MHEDVQAWHSKLCDMSTEGIVKLMEDENIRAFTGVSSMCAVSELIFQKTGTRPLTGYTGTFVESILYGEHSPSLYAFIRNFDDHKYPHLEK